MYTGMPPTDVDFETFKANYGNGGPLRPATYREGYLQKLFNRPFSPIAFTYVELGKRTPTHVVDRLIKEIGLKPKIRRREAKIKLIKSAIRRASKKFH